MYYLVFKKFFNYDSYGLYVHMITDNRDEAIKKAHEIFNPLEELDDVLVVLIDNNSSIPADIGDLSEGVNTVLHLDAMKSREA